MRAFIKKLPAYNEVASMAVSERNATNQATLIKVIDDGRALGRRLENFVKGQKKQGAGTDPLATPSKSGRGGIGSSGGLAGDQMATKSDFARLERMIDDLGGLIERTAQDAFDAKR